MIDDIEIVAPGIRAALGECPLWVGDRLFWVDVVSPSLYVLDAGEATPRRIPLPRPPGCLLPLEDRGDRVLVALRNGLLEVDVAAETTTPRALHGFDLGDRRFNDGRCDAKGRVWLGMMDRQIVRPIGGILCLDAFGVEETAGDVVLSNGLCFSPDCRTLYMADTRAGRVFAFDLGERGLSNRRILLQVETGDGSPDGCTVDSEGCLWIALVNGSALIRVSPQGQVLRRVELPVTKPTSCAFGGPGLATLYVTSARHRLATPGPLDGVVLALRDLRVHGLPEHPAKLSLPGI